MSYDNFPQKLREQRQWVVWKMEKVEGKKKPTKILYSPTGYKASSTDPNTWSTFEKCLEVFNASGDFSGIGYVFTKGIIGIDLDNCFDSTGMKKWAKDIFDRFESYAEFSPSKKGIHLILESDIDFQGRKKNLEDNSAIECYMRARYFTVTGDVYENRNKLNHIPEEEVFGWYKDTFETKEILIQQIPLANLVMPSDETIIDFMRTAKNGLKFIALYDYGNWEGQNFKSQSEADMSLVSSLMFFCCNDDSVVDRIFRSSKLYRKKWDRNDYRNELLKKCKHTQIMDWKNPTKCEEPDFEDELVVRSLKDVRPINVRWLWKSRLAKGKITLIQGYPGQGKSQITIYMAAIISKGGVFIDGDECEKGTTLFITAEDDASDTLVPRLMAQDTEMDNILELQWVKTADGKIKLFNFDKYMEQLRKTIATLDNLKLIVVDPISAFLGKVDGNASSEVRGLLYELKSVAESKDCAVILITHNNKNSGQQAISRASGSHAFGAAARMVYTCGVFPVEDEEEIVKNKKFAIAPIKNNLTKDPPTLVYTIEGAIVDGYENEIINTSKIVWGEESTITGQELVDYMPNKGKMGRPADKYQECLDMLKSMIGDESTISSKKRKEIQKELRSCDFKDAMIKKALDKLGFYTVVVDGISAEWRKKTTIEDF